MVAERHSEKAFPSAGPRDQPLSPDPAGQPAGGHDPTGPAGGDDAHRPAASGPDRTGRTGADADPVGGPPDDIRPDDIQESALGDETGPADTPTSAGTPSGASVRPTVREPAQDGPAQGPGPPRTRDRGDEPSPEASGAGPSPSPRAPRIGLRDRIRSPIATTVPEGPLRPVLRVLSFVLTVALLLAGIRFFLVQTFVIPSGSMENTLRVGDRVLVSRWSYRFGEIQRGDVVVFDGDGVFNRSSAESDSPLASVGRGIARALGVPVGETDYVKRVIGLPGDRVTCCDAQGRLTVNGGSLSEPYLYPGDSPSELRFDIVVPEGRLWVMGDHRSDSGDSREHMREPSGGTVPVGQVVGRVVAVWWPLDRWSGTGRSGTLLESGGGQEGGS